MCACVRAILTKTNHRTLRWSPLKVSPYICVYLSLRHLLNIHDCASERHSAVALSLRSSSVSAWKRGERVGCKAACERWQRRTVGSLTMPRAGASESFDSIWGQNPRSPLPPYNTETLCCKQGWTGEHNLAAYFEAWTRFVDTGYSSVFVEQDESLDHTAFEKRDAKAAIEGDASLRTTYCGTFRMEEKYRD